MKIHNVTAWGVYTHTAKTKKKFITEHLLWIKKELSKTTRVATQRIVLNLLPDIILEGLFFPTLCHFIQRRWKTRSCKFLVHPH